MRNAGCQAGFVSHSLKASYDLVALQGQHPQRYPCLLASTAQSTGDDSLSRYDLLLAFPQATLELSQQGELAGTGMSPQGNEFLAALDHWWSQETCLEDSQVEKPLPFRGGWFLYLGYELAGEIEPVLALETNHNSRLPVACAMRIPAAIIHDYVTGITHLVAEKAYETYLEQLQTDLETFEAAKEMEVDVGIELEEDPPQHYLAGINRVKDYIVAGDVFQVNLSRQWHGRRPAELSPTTVFRQLAKANPAPFAGCARFGEQAVVSSSPERLVRTRGNVIETRPIAGTRPRGEMPEDDQAMLSELIAHPKERAEHIMLIDLERNDLGRVCQPGTIEVNELMALESYRHVHHIVSNVRGELRAGITPGDVIRAVFPGGTITGCPKVRCMEIISELEQCARGPYTGSMGYLNHNGDMDLNILIRTIVLDNGKIVIRAGAGLVADSDPQHELDETRAKARGMLLSLHNPTTERSDR